MVRHYKSKGTRMTYPETLLDRAKKMVSEGKSLRSVSKELKIEKMFLHRYLKKQTDLTVENKVRPTNSPGHKLALGEENEKTLSEHLKSMAKNGFALSKEEVLDVVQLYVEQNGLKVPFKNNRPGHDWHKAFCERQKLSLKKMEPLEMKRKVNTSDPFIIYEFYDLYEGKVKELGLEDKPSHIFNLDESSFCSDPSRIKLVSGVGQKAHRLQEGTGRENTTVLACCNAAGKVLPPLIVFQGANLWSTWKGGNDMPGTFYACSEKGWMTSAVFHQYFQKFCEEVKERPLLLIFDGHLTHLDVDTAVYAKKNQIEIIKLPAHTTDVLQPLDTACFKNLKYTWDMNLLKWYRGNQRKLTKSEFVDMLCSIWFEGITSENIKSGFRSVGLFPLDRNKYPVSRLNPEKLNKYNAEKQQLPAPTNSNSTAHVHDVSNGASTSKQPQPSPSDAPLSAVPSRPTSATCGCFQDLENPTGSQPSTPVINSRENSLGPSPSSFEMLLLQKIKKTAAPTTTRRRLDVKAAVITSEEWIDSEKKKKEQEDETRRQKEMRKVARKPKVRRLNEENKKEVANKLQPESYPNEKTNSEKGAGREQIRSKRKQKKKQKKSKKRNSWSDTDSEIASDTEFPEDESDECDRDELLREIEMEEQSDLEFEELLQGNNETEPLREVYKPKTNDWIVARFQTKKNEFHFVGQVTAVIDDEPQVKFTRVKEISEETTIFYWKEPEDISLIDRDDVLEQLPEPDLGRRGELIFPSLFENYKLQ